MSDEQELDLRSAVYTPTQVSTYGIDAVRAAKNLSLRGARLNIAEIRDYFAPLLPGQLCAVIAQTSHYKSGFLHFWEHQLAEQLLEEGRDNEVIIHVSVEEGVEEQAFLEFARYSNEDPGKLARGDVQDWDKLMDAALHIGKIPIYRVGDSLARAEDMPLLYISNMIRAIKKLVEGNLLDWKPKVAGMFFDYLQAFPFDPEINLMGSAEQKRRLQVRSDIYRLRQAAAYFMTPVVVAVQAKQNLEGANPPIMLPGIYDGEESSSIAQRCDRVITMWMPKQTNPVGTIISRGEFNFSVKENQLWVKIAKQRGGLPAGKAWPCIIDFRTNTIAPERRLP